jgi:hypothetical protein
MLCKVGQTGRMQPKSNINLHINWCLTWTDFWTTMSGASMKRKSKETWRLEKKKKKVHSILEFTAPRWGLGNVPSLYFDKCIKYWKTFKNKSNTGQQDWHFPFCWLSVWWRPLMGTLTASLQNGDYGWLTCFSHLSLLPPAMLG